MWRLHLCWLHTVCTTTTLLRIPHLGEHCPDVLLAEINHAAALVFLPYETRGLHGICDGNLVFLFHWSVKLSVRHPCPPPLLGGCLALRPPRLSCSHRFIVTTLSMEAFWTSCSERTLRQASVIARAHVQTLALLCLS